MNRSPYGEDMELTQPDTTASAGRSAVSDPNSIVLTLFVDGPDKEHQLQLSGLRNCICELLITNQRLRMALMERREVDESNRN
jgi:hypothetical protein